MTIQQQINEFIDAQVAPVSHFPQVGGIVENVKGAIDEGTKALADGIREIAAREGLRSDLVEKSLIDLGLVAEPEPEPAEPETDSERLARLEATVEDLASTVRRAIAASGLTI